MGDHQSSFRRFDQSTADRSSRLWMAVALRGNMTSRNNIRRIVRPPCPMERPPPMCPPSRPRSVSSAANRGVGVFWCAGSCTLRTLGVELHVEHWGKPHGSHNNVRQFVFDEWSGSLQWDEVPRHHDGHSRMDGHFRVVEVERYPRTRWEFRILQTGFRSAVPHWFLILICSLLAILTRIPLLEYRIPLHFSLRTLLIATTLAAVVLGWSVTIFADMFLIRPATDDDSAAAEEVARRAFAEMRQIYRPKEDLSCRSSLARCNWLPRPRAAIVGTVMFAAKEDRLHLRRLAVDAAFRRRGITRRRLSTT